MVHCIIQGDTGFKFETILQFFSLKIIFVLANSVDPEEMPHYAGVRSGPVVECLTQDRRAVGSSLTGVTALWS